jgi:hypothetical protein
LKLSYYKLLSPLGFNFKLRRYTEAGAAALKAANQVKAVEIARVKAEAYAAADAAADAATKVATKTASKVWTGTIVQQYLDRNIFQRYSPAMRYSFIAISDGSNHKQFARHVIQRMRVPGFESNPVTLRAMSAGPYI